MKMKMNFLKNLKNKTYTISLFNGPLYISIQTDSFHCAVNAGHTSTADPPVKHGKRNLPVDK